MSAPEPAYAEPESTEYSAPSYSALQEDFDISTLIVPVLLIVGKMKKMFNTCKLHWEWSQIELSETDACSPPCLHCN